MRRKEREVENIEEIFDILNRCDTIKIAMHNGVYPYIVPVSFGTEIVDNKFIIYFHCAQSGMKIDLLKANPNVCVEGEIFIFVLFATKILKFQGVYIYCFLIKVNFYLEAKYIKTSVPI